MRTQESHHRVTLLNVIMMKRERSILWNPCLELITIRGDIKRLRELSIITKVTQSVGDHPVCARCRLGGLVRFLGLEQVIRHERSLAVDTMR